MTKGNGDALIDDRPLTPGQMEEMRRKWLTRTDDSMPWDGVVSLVNTSNKHSE